MPEQAEQLATAEDLADLSGLPVDAPAVKLALRRASNRFLGETNRKTFIAGTPVTERYNGKGGPALLLRGAPVVSIESLTLNGRPLTEGTDYRLDDEAGIVELVTGCWPQQIGCAVIVYSHGYLEVPGDVEDAVLEHAHTLADIAAYVQNESGGSTQAGYWKEAQVGVTAKWVSTVSKYNLGQRS